ncbi:polyprenyl synthetase family protein [Roseivirga sp. BDSF3-8]|uniref:polyprenyl synthetase family protein n=1 Tax=Roseivirga sp. BDSF3-8 TaxID=3241598 RepID=UPI003531EC69
MTKDLVDLIDRINRELATQTYGEKPYELYEPIRYIMGLGGKRLRPVLALISSSMYSGNVETTLRPAMAIEVFHNFTLMHDDIMDQAPLRRGEATVHEKFGSNIAILSGDVMMVKAYEMIMALPDAVLRTGLAAFNRCAVEVCEGQQMDMNFESREDVTIGQYLHMIRLKTAVLLGFSLELGALVGNAPEQDRLLLREFGQQIGVGFQLKDDLLDVFGEQEKVGKQEGGDIVSNKKTFLLITALQDADEETAKELKHWLTMQDFDKAEKVEAVKKIYNQLNIKEKTEAKMDECFEGAFSLLDKLSISVEKQQNLRYLANYLIERDK